MHYWQQELENIPTNSLLISTSQKKLLRFYCPITAVCTTPVALLNKDEQVSIEGIFQDENGRLVYLIDGLKLPHTHFEIIK